MKELLTLAWDVLLFKDDAYKQHVARADVLKRGLALLVVATLIAGTLSFIVGISRGLRSVESQREQADQNVQEFVASFQDMQQYSDLPPEFTEMVIASIRAGVELGFGVAELSSPLPRSIGGVLSALGAFLSLPFTRMASWAGYTIWVLLIAKLMGGRATIAQALGATALYAVPHVLDILDIVPYLGGLLGLIATVWGIAIYVKALAVANDFDIGRAVAATVIPAVVNAALIAMGMLGFLILIMASG